MAVDLSDRALGSGGNVRDPFRKLDGPSSLERNLESTIELLKAVFDNALRRHPLPWRIHSDWTHEVLAADGMTMAKCKSVEEARAVIDYAVLRKQELDAIGDELPT